MKFEFISIKDPHLSLGFQNKIRKNYEQDITTKFNFVKQYCLDNNIKHIVFTGDVFDSSREINWSFKKYRKNKRLLGEFKLAGIKIHSNVGNHDMFHGHEDSSNTVFGEMVNDQILNNITTDPLIFEMGNKVIIIQGVDYSVDNSIVSERIKKFDSLKYPGMHLYKICVLHSNITPSENEFSDFTYSHMSETYNNIDVFICGHYHVGYKTKLIDRKEKPLTIINNWNFTRVIRDYETKLNEHTPEFEHITIEADEDFKVSTKTIKVPFAPYDQAFIPELIKFGSLSKKEISRFFKEINIDQIKQSSSKSDEDLINIIAKEKSFDKEVKELALYYLNEN